MQQPLEKFKELQDVDSVENYENLFFGLTPAIHKIFKSISSCMHFFTWLKDNLKGKYSKIIYNKKPIIPTIKKLKQSNKFLSYEFINL